MYYSIQVQIHLIHEFNEFLINMFAKNSQQNQNRNVSLLSSCVSETNKAKYMSIGKFDNQQM